MLHASDHVHGPVVGSNSDWLPQAQRPLLTFLLVWPPHPHMYESTTDELYNLWDSISPGGYVIIDDWG